MATNTIELVVRDERGDVKHSVALRTRYDVDAMEDAQASAGDYAETARATLKRCILEAVADAADEIVKLVIP